MVTVIRSQLWSCSGGYLRINQKSFSQEVVMSDASITQINEARLTDFREWSHLQFISFLHGPSLGQEELPAAPALWFQSPWRLRVPFIACSPACDTVSRLITLAYHRACQSPRRRGEVGGRVLWLSFLTSQSLAGQPRGAPGTSPRGQVPAISLFSDPTRGGNWLKSHTKSVYSEMMSQFIHANMKCNFLSSCWQSLPCQHLP